MKVTIIYPVEPSYIFGLVYGLSKISELKIDLIGTDRTKVMEGGYPNVKVINLRGSQEQFASTINKFIRIVSFYFKLFVYIAKTDSSIIHFHWPNRFFFFDSTILLLYYKLFNKKLVYTAHNIDQAMRDKKGLFSKDIAYKLMYRLIDKIIVHNILSREILVNKFNVDQNKIVINKLGINLITAKSGLDQDQARNKFGLSRDKKVILFFGGILPYKGLDILLEAFSKLPGFNNDYVLIIAGQPRDKDYFNIIKELILKFELENKCIQHYEFIPDEEVEFYFMAADCAVLPYKFIFQSGVHALSYSFGLPIIASDVGSFKDEDVIEGKTGFICLPDDPDDLAKTILTYFSSNLYRELKTNRSKIKEWAYDNYSWDTIGQKTYKIYDDLLKKN